MISAPMTRGSTTRCGAEAWPPRPVMWIVKLVLAGHDGTGASEQVASGRAGMVVQAVDAVDREAVEESVVDHGPGASAGLFAGLEDRAHGAVEAALFGEDGGRSEPHGQVPVVAAGVHGSRMDGGVRHATVLGDRQAVELGPQADGSGGRPAGQRAHDPGAADAGGDVEAEVGEHGGHVGAGLVLGERRFRDAVEVVSPVAQAGMRSTGSARSTGPVSGGPRAGVHRGDVPVWRDVPLRK